MEKSLVESHTIFEHIPHTLQLQGLVPRKVPTIVDVMNSTERGWQNLHIVFKVILNHTFLIEVIYPFLTCICCNLDEPLTICERGVLSTAEVSVYQITDGSSKLTYPAQTVLWLEHQDQHAGLQPATSYWAHPLCHTP